MCDEGKRGLLESWLAREREGRGKISENQTSKCRQHFKTHTKTPITPQHHHKFHTELLTPLPIPSLHWLVNLLGTLSHIDHTRTFELSWAATRFHANTLECLPKASSAGDVSPNTSSNSFKPFRIQARILSLVPLSV